MGQPPAFLFVVRHGFRLDAADKQWHLSSPTPYDPPLTYSGWQQAKNLGVRIASIIRDKVEKDEATARQQPNSQTKRKRKRYKVVLHSSPFLRCIQTSIAISAGLAQDSTPFGPSNATSTDARKSIPTPVQSPLSRPTIVTDVLPTNPIPIRRSVLRLDAFLGEWLAPQYFELITPPPESVMMLASAKADLLRREDYSSYPNFSAHVYSNSQGQLWSPVSRANSFAQPPSAPTDNSETLSTSSTSPRTSSLAISNPGVQSRRVCLAQSICSDSSGYVSPVPHYAVSNNNTIPSGYVAHARDNCVDIDYQWDSMRPPLNWGDGGTFPEEWTDMHKRFRKGVQNLVDWYSTAENPTEMVTKVVTRSVRKPSDEDEEIETEAVVIMVSHGAGCNALIGAITHQPVLTDVGMTSLTMAVREPLEDNPGLNLGPKDRSRPPVHEQYKIELFASTDHIRSPPSTTLPSRQASIAGGVNGNRRHANSYASSLNNLDNVSFNESSATRNSSANAALSSLRTSTSSPNTSLRQGFGTRSRGGGITVGSGMTSFGTKSYSLARNPSIGLWSPTSTGFGEEAEDDDDGMVLNFSHEKHAPISDPNADSGSATLSALGLSLSTTTPPPDLDVKSVTPLGITDDPQITPRLATPIGLMDSSASGSSTQGEGDGLWGGEPRPADEADLLRDLTSTKRRWTVTERG